MGRISILVNAALLIALVGCQQKETTNNKPTKEVTHKEAVPDTESAPSVANALAVIDGAPISEGQFMEYIRPYPERMKENAQGRDYVLQAMIDQILLEGEARRRGLDREPEFVAKVDAYRRNLLNNRLLDTVKQGGFEVSAEEAKKYFDSHPDEFDRPERVNVRHILVSTEEEAQDLKSQLRKGAKFEELARKQSKDNFSKERGGELGPFSRKQRPDLAEAAFKLRSPGKLAGPVKTARGFHILQLVARIPAEKDKFDAIRDSLINRLRARRRQEAKKELLASVREKAQIKVNQEALETLEITK